LSANNNEFTNENYGNFLSFLISYVLFSSRGDPWRRFGALQAIHRIGGWVAAPGRRKNKEFTYVKPGTRMEHQAQPSKFCLVLLELLNF
jgi:hypothetical protein